MKQHEGEGHLTGLEPIEQSKEFIEAQRIYEKAQKRIEAEEEAIAQIQYNMDNIEIGEGEDRDLIMEQMQSEIAQHKSNIENIAENRDKSIRDVLSMSPSERTGAGIDRNRWESANPYNGPNN